MFNILIVILGCNINFILNDRVSKAMEFMNLNENNNINFELFLTGGKKNIYSNELSEAEKMLKKLNLNKTNYFIDDISENTVENFYHLQIFLKTKNYSKIFIITSKFHYERANNISKYFIQNENVFWLLSYLDIENSYENEKYHFQNIEKDIKKLENKIKCNQTINYF